MGRKPRDDPCTCKQCGKDFCHGGKNRYTNLKRHEESCGRTVVKEVEAEPLRDESKHIGYYLRDLVRFRYRERLVVPNVCKAECLFLEDGRVQKLPLVVAVNKAMLEVRPLVPADKDWALLAPKLETALIKCYRNADDLSRPALVRKLRATKPPPHDHPQSAEPHHSDHTHP